MGKGGQRVLSREPEGLQVPFIRGLQSQSCIKTSCFLTSPESLEDFGGWDSVLLTTLSPAPSWGLGILEPLSESVRG